MRGFLNIIKLAIKYGGLVLVIVDILQYSLDRFEGFLNPSNKKEKEKETNDIKIVK